MNICKAIFRQLIHQKTTGSLELKKGCSTALYNNNHTRCENEANRHMIHKLLEEELALSDDQKSFNYLQFMQKHELRTVADELMVIDEYYELIG